MVREKSDDRVVPKGRRKTVQTAGAWRGGKAVTERERADQLGLRFETADSPRGVDGGTVMGEPKTVPRAMPKSKHTRSTGLRPMTMDEVVAERNLRRAFENVASNDGAAGPDGKSIVDVRRHLDDVIAKLRRTLLDGTYRPGEIRRVWIPKAGGGERGLGIPNVVDRLVQQAVHQVLSPQYEMTFHDSSHGFRPGRSCHTAIAEARKHLAEGYEWVVDLDLSKFFDRVHHERLLARLVQRVHDARVVELIRRMLKAKVVMPDGVVVASEEGAPQGGPLSPLLSNIVLDELDRELAQRGHRFVRYADDCNIYVRSERAGQRVMANVSRYIDKRLRLVVNVEKSAVARPEERHFLGFSLHSHVERDSVSVSVSERSKRRIDARIRELIPRNWGQSMACCIERLNRYLRGWISFFGICTSERTFTHLDSHIRRRLRALQLVQWRSKSTIARRLIEAGAKPSMVYGNVFHRRRGPWTMSAMPSVNQGLGISFWAKRGLVSLGQRYKELRIVLGSTQLALRFE